MGRPLPSRFFGNRNTGSSSTVNDDGLGGEGIESFTLPVQKGVVNITDTYKYFPTLTIPAPNVNGGVQATSTVVWELNTVSVSSGGSGYTINQTGATVTSLSGSIWTDASTVPGLTINTNGSGAVTAINIVTRGEWTNIDGTGISTWAVVGAGGSNAQITATFRLKSISIVEKGSGYTSAPTLSWARGSSQTAGGQTQTGTPTAVLTTPDGSVTDAGGYNFAAIKISAQTTSGGSNLTGDIISQKGSRRYRVNTSDGTAVCSLVAATPSAAGEMSLIATDYSGNTYYVTKLTRHRVLLTQNTGSTWEFATNSSAAWTLDSLVAGDTGVTVQLANN